MQTTAITTARQSPSSDLRVVEHSRGTAHPAVGSQRDRVTRSLLLRPDLPAGRDDRR